MADIIAWGDKHKKLIKIADGWLRKKMGASVTVVHKDLQNCGNPVFSRIAEYLNYAANQVKEDYQKRMMLDYGELFLWILYKDTAYRDPALWVLYQLLKNSDVLIKEIEPYVKEPDDWYVNAWHDSKKHSKEQQAEGKIPKTVKSFDESIFTPPEQSKRLQKYNKKK